MINTDTLRTIAHNIECASGNDVYASVIRRAADELDAERPVVQAAVTFWRNSTDAVMNRKREGADSMNYTRKESEQSLMIAVTRMFNKAQVRR